MTNQRFTDKVAIVTGAARGLGRSQALSFAKEGALVAALDIGENKPKLAYELGRREELIETVDECKKISERDSIPLYADVSNPEQVNRAIEEVISKFGRIDILVNNAGISTGAQLSHDISEDDWDKVLAVNLKGVWLCCKSVTPYMIKHKNGKIVNISSIAGIIAFSHYANYVASKFGVVGLTKTLAIELADHNVNVNCVCPGIVATPLNDADAISAGFSIEEGRKEFIKGHLFDRLIPKEDIAKAVLWLSSDDANNITGIVLPVDAGHSTTPPG